MAKMQPSATTLLIRRLTIASCAASTRVGRKVPSTSITAATPTPAAKSRGVADHATTQAEDHPARHGIEVPVEWVLLDQGIYRGQAAATFPGCRKAVGRVLLASVEVFEIRQGREGWLPQSRTTSDLLAGCSTRNGRNRERGAGHCPRQRESGHSCTRSVGHERA
jgi:hypothetical protein